MLLALSLLVGVAFVVFFAWPLRDPHPALRVEAGAAVLRDATLFVAPGEVRPHSDLLVQDGRIVAVGPSLEVPPGARVLCERCFVTAGLWNTHVHFGQPRFRETDAQVLDDALAQMLTSRGFTTVVDLGSDPRVTVSLRRRIEAGELQGPTILTAAGALYPPNGTPYYLRDTMPQVLQWLLARPETPADARADVERNASRGADLTKLFTGSYVERGVVKPMPVEVARAAVEAAHQRGQLVFAHPSNLEGTRVALESGVDVLAHVPDTTEGVDDALLASLVAHHVAMVPTLKMFSDTVSTAPAYLEPIHDVLRRFRALGARCSSAPTWATWAMPAPRRSFRRSRPAASPSMTCSAR
jgi:imidazolonepropionase-like amidohydrolase